MHLQLLRERSKFIIKRRKNTLFKTPKTKPPLSATQCPTKARWMGRMTTYNILQAKFLRRREPTTTKSRSRLSRRWFWELDKPKTPSKSVGLMLKKLPSGNYLPNSVLTSISLPRKWRLRPESKSCLNSIVKIRRMLSKSTKPLKVKFLKSSKTKQLLKMTEKKVRYNI